MSFIDSFNSINYKFDVIIYNHSHRINQYIIEKNGGKMLTSYSFKYLTYIVSISDHIICIRHLNKNDDILSIINKIWTTMQFPGFITAYTINNIIAKLRKNSISETFDKEYKNINVSFHNIVTIYSSSKNQLYETYKDMYMVMVIENILNILRKKSYFSMIPKDVIDYILNLYYEIK